MGLLDQILAEALGGTQGGTQPGSGMQPGGMQGGGMPGRGMQGTPATGQQRNQLLELALNFVQNYPGGLSGLVAAITGAGYGKQARSWVGTGQNMQISEDDLSQIIGQGNVESMGRRSGLSTGAAAGGLAALLPALSHQPSGQGNVESMGRRSGLSTGAAAGGLAALLPAVIDQLTPKGQVDDDTDLGAALNSLRSRA